MCGWVALLALPRLGGATHASVTDNSFQRRQNYISWPNGADVERKVIVRRQLKRRYFLAGQNALSK
jgi:hypothetical protein